MRLIIRAPKKHVEVQQHTARRIGFVLSRFAPKVASVTVVVAEHDGEVVSCSVRIRCSPSWEVVEEVADEDVYAAVERAVARAARSMERALPRGSSTR
jgi:ribosome-associated translation inhibitor RaiA